MAGEDSSGIRGRFINFLFGSVLAGLVTTGFTYKTWREQTRLDLAKQQLAEATKTFDNASQLMSKRVFLSYNVAQNLDSDDDAAFAKRIEKLQTAIEDWNLDYADALQDFQFALEIDENGKIRPFHEVTTRDFERSLVCGRAFDDSNRPKGADWGSPSWLLAALHHCFIMARVRQTALELRQKSPQKLQTVNAQIDALAKAERQKRIDALDRAIDDLKTHSEQVRVASKKAIQRLRNAVETHSFVEFLQGW